ncbi:hypothetical protein Eistla_gp31 [Pelagibacter phage Eistla EXVC025P]|nr:hypothetical protein Eistla_gp31 [Pelagibacter phage Eistla EXVC025P]
MKHTDKTWTKEYDLKNNFRYCLEKGKLGEDLVNKLLNKEITFEVKTDFMCKDTGNVFVEYKSRGKDSGIKISTAIYWVFVLPYNKTDFPNLQFIPLVKLKKLIETKKYKIVNGGDALTSKGYLIPKEDLLTLIIQEKND